MESAKSTGLSRSYDKLTYLVGLGNHFGTEAKPGALPVGQNSPQKVTYDLYAEQISGTAFTAPRAANQKVWQYKIQPTAVHKPFKKSDSSKYKHIKNDFMNKENIVLTPQQLRWKAFELPTADHPKNFVEGLITQLGAGDPTIRTGLVIYQYVCNKSMHNSAFYSSDGDFLIVPQQGTLYIATEMGKMTVKPREICVIPRGIRFAVEVTEASRGWVAETFKGHFKIPDLGPIGANGLANPRDFEIPSAWYENTTGTFTIYNKYMGEVYEHEQDHSCFDCVAWHGNYYPYKYNLDLFNAMNTVTYDHPDPSIFTVLTCQTDEPGVAVLDFVIFPPRWMVGEHTFRPPYYHRNVATEYMGNISGKYDAKEDGFGPGQSSLHSYMTGHGPEAEVFEKASNMELKPVRYPYDNLSFMFESSYMMKTTSWVMEDKMLDLEYYKCWSGCKKAFTE